MSYFKTALLMAGLTALFLAVGYLIAGQSGMIVALALAIGINLFAYWNSDKMVLARFGAEPASEDNAPGLNGIVAELARQAGLPKPKVYLVPGDQPNAFATGRNPEHAALAVTRGLLQHLSYEEIAGVVSHELAHVKNRDTLIMTITAAFAGAIGMIANFALFFGRSRNNPLGPVGALLVMLFAPLAAMLVQMAISRTREYAADRIGAGLSGRPLWLASALEKLGALSGRIAYQDAEANPAAAHLFIVNPLRGSRALGLFSTHPRLEERIARLREIARTMGQL